MTVTLHQLVQDWLREENIRDWHFKDLSYYDKFPLRAKPSQYLDHTTLNFFFYVDLDEIRIIDEEYLNAANTTLKEGGWVPRDVKSIAAGDPELFEKLKSWMEHFESYVPNSRRKSL
jgi:hypothetical protein